MSFFRVLRRLTIAICLLMLSLPAFARDTPHPILDPRHVDGMSMGNALDLTSTWLMQQGDDPRYADPKFDDSPWKVVKAGVKPVSYGFKNVNMVWYRTHVRIVPGQRNLSLLMRGFGGSFEIYVNGVEVGSSGPSPPGGSGNAIFDIRFEIPGSLVQTGDVAIAIRAAIARSSDHGNREGGFASYTTMLMGPTPELADAKLLYLFRNYTSNTINILMQLLVMLIALALALTLPKEREYLALTISSAAGVISDSMGVWRNLTNFPPNDLWFFLTGCLGAIAVVASLEFVRLALGLKRTRAWAIYEWVIIIMLLGPVPVVNHMFALGATGPTSGFIVAVNLVAAIVTLPFATGLPVLALWVWWKRRNPDALLLFVPLFLSAVVGYCQAVLFVLNFLHMTETSSLPIVPSAIFLFQWSEVASFLFSVALLLFLVLRTVRIARSRAAMASDLHAVQSVQEILLARASHETPGFVVEHVYHPAQEVGGDFFLVSPGPDGSLTAIVGDVSGKGLVAAMRVSMILGVLRREEQRDPEAILRNLNEALLLQGEMGFTTACAVRLERDGRYTIANAGHISPYIGGEEVVTPSSLPLGIEDGQEYGQVCGWLPAGKTMVLMSDGVVEARSAKGELYGFERLSQLTLMTAEDIADVARRFGQEDDITVLTMACAV